MPVDDTVASVISIGVAVLRAERRDNAVVVCRLSAEGGIFFRRDDTQDTSAAILNVAGLCPLATGTGATSTDTYPFEDWGSKFVSP